MTLTIHKSWRKSITKWEKIESAPRDGIQILCCYGKDNSYSIISFQDGVWSVCDAIISAHIEEDIINYWMDLPKPPKKKHQCGEQFECYRDEKIKEKS